MQILKLNNDSIKNLFHKNAEPSPRISISNVHDKRNTLLSPLFPLIAFRFFMQLSLEEYGNNEINRIKSNKNKPKQQLLAKKHLASSLMDFLSKSFAFAFWMIIP